MILERLGYNPWAFTGLLVLYILVHIAHWSWKRSNHEIRNSIIIRNRTR